MQRLEIYAVIPNLTLFAQQLHNLTALSALGMYYRPGSSAATSALASALATCSSIQELALDADVPVSRQKRGLEVSAHSCAADSVAPCSHVVCEKYAIRQVDSASCCRCWVQSIGHSVLALNI